MVAFPDPEDRPKLLSITDLASQNQKSNKSPADAHPDPAPKQENHAKINNDHSFTVGDNKADLTLDVGKFSKNDYIEISNLNADEVTAKKIAASLKLPFGAYSEKNGLPPPSPGGGSLSSSSSIVTITSITNSDPDPDFPVGSPGSGDKRKIVKAEKWYTTTVQISVPFFIAGIGTIGAGLVLSNVQNWPVFVAVSELFILVPALLGLKGNLDMCLASRLSTQANIGNMTSFREIMKMIIGNVVLVQIQASVAAILVSIFALSVGAVMQGQFVWNHALLLTTSSICTATSSCFVLDFVMIAVIMVSHRCKMNPDNLATPLAASIGDVVSITVLATVASALFKILDNQIWILYLILGGYICLLPLWICIVLKNKYTRNVLKTGWTPVLSALFISGLGGLVLDQAVDVFDGFVIFQPIINGIGGNLVSVQASRISTLLHQTSIMGILPPHAKIFVSPWAALFKGVPYAKTARILMGMAIPGQLVFIFTADYIQWGYSTLQIYFILSYLTAALLQIMLLLYIAHIIIHAMWRYKIDPDNSAIPYLTSLGDLTGSLLLAGAFKMLQSIGYEYGDY
ncbi:solute carrier family 41 member 1-like [Neodiprion virginianus]|uniref:solute carrier family 41 member 1-like n=1 Tax=Neodiprion fabricii TaxID=2872261 RepID=UPI001ED91D8B|nr:solute carrier family 41 member 1-like [Neodiprion fabricii]XP_046427029.1 solute carrier family 41 member 1-like [Neodiprion fabricii]XP_046427030.1 solute carrier family 41 member 1-like [Neodiprion fabricii]XP_046621001.1 solute carrier family 41 member 1-like [Neodiprion virginianus]XP_046621002.1 solute carrier family 41 member 1-like [Neodiprion virginianus]XP_046621003.1 solute carrier family 41 member 1-like [Neodiprion virginianus]